MKVIFIVNPHAKNGYAYKRFLAVKNKGEANSIEYWVTSAPFEAVEKIRHYCENHVHEKTLFAGIGGDGTMHELVNATARFPHAYVTSIAAGSGNDFARHFSSFPLLPESFHELSNWDGTNEKHDAARFKGQKTGWFVNNLGIGFDAAVANSSNRSRFKKWLNRIKLGKLIYVYYLIYHLISYKPQSMKVQIDGKTLNLKKVWFITIANQPYYGGGMMIAPYARSDDGMLDLTIVHHLSRLKFLTVFFSVFFGGHLRFKEVTTEQGKQIKVETEEQALIHADGEFGGSLIRNHPIYVEVEPKSWSFVPSKKQGS
ncbi:diacylglycerol/lipid kinase family protein [Jeotgalibacillus proteolyticus]|uniref:diacylglycerol/lipid kinase family protein n=1 Tax=Jeotgalibacillus proteolyticus TaxID=2082395 RepID=UPI003CF0B834